MDERKENLKVIGEQFNQDRICHVTILENTRGLCVSKWRLFIFILFYFFRYLLSPKKTWFSPEFGAKWLIF